MSATLTTVAPTMAAHVEYAAMDAHYDAEYENWIDQQEAIIHGPVGETMTCYTCEHLVGEYAQRTCVALGPVTNAADPTQTYRLDCGHITI